MESLVDRDPAPAASAPAAPIPIPAAAARAASPTDPALSRLLAAAVVGATSICVGLLWDISWHASIGRDTFWTPAHLAIYLGGLLCGLSAGWEALATTFGGTPQRRAATVRFWGFRAPLGAWVAIWGALAMITSAPFDDWWHSAYGLDVRIISPPHVLLAAGIVATLLGAMLLALAAQNRAAAAAGAGAATGTGATPPAAGGATLRDSLPALAYTYAAGCLLAIVMTLFLEHSAPNQQHSALFYEFACAAYPALLVAAAWAANVRWPATLVAAFAMAIRLIMTWVLPLFPATPRLAPIYNPIHHMWPLFFPPLLIVPAVAIDLLLARRRRLPGGRPLLALALAAAFFAAFLATQWYFADFMLTPGARNWFFAADSWTYHTRPGAWQHQFRPGGGALDAGAAALCLLYATVSAWIGIAWGGWMSRVRR
jgi:hypothetical protein